MKILGIFCAGNLGKEIYDIVERIQMCNETWKDIVFIDNYTDADNFYGIKVYRLDNWKEMRENIEFVIASGEPSIRREIYYQLKEGGYKLTTIIDPTALVSPTAKIGEGVIVTPFSSISSDVVLKDNVLIQSYVRVGHDICVNEHSVISANVSIGGNTLVGEEVFIGLGAVIKGELTIGKGAILSMGAVLYRDLNENTTAAGNPARETKRNDGGRVFG